MSNARRSANINVMAEAAEKAGRSLVRDFGEVENLQVSKKGPGDFVSTADLKSEKILKAMLQKARPKYGFLLEESGEEKGEDLTCRWIADPLDGTTNFLHGIPHWSVSIALEKNGEIVAGVVYDPLKDEMFWAEKGLGAYVNNRRIVVSGRKQPMDAVLAVGEDFFKNQETIPFPCAGFRRFGGACLDLCYVAAGRVDGFWERGLKPWDAAAASLIVKEARGIVTDFSGGKDFIYGGTTLAANPALHAELLKHLGSGQKRTKVAT
jgi:myo-inositol-1(or 4)-monophosphatase